MSNAINNIYILFNMKKKHTINKVKNYLLIMLKTCSKLFAYILLLFIIIQIGILFESYQEKCNPLTLKTEIIENPEKIEKNEQIENSEKIEKNEQIKTYIKITCVLIFLLILYCNCPEPTIISETKPINPNFINDLLKSNAFIKTLKQMPRFPNYPENSE